MKYSKPLTLGFALFLFTAIGFPLHAQDSPDTSEAARLKKLEDAVRQLQQRNAQLESEVHELKTNRGPMAPILASPEGKATAGNDSKAVFTAPTPPPVYATAGGSEYKLTLGGYIQMNLESGDVSAFEGRFGMTALKDRLRLRRARINLIGDFAEQFDFKIEGDFEQIQRSQHLVSLDVTTRATTTVTNSNRAEFSRTDIFTSIGTPFRNEFQGRTNASAPFGLGAD